MYQWEPPAGWSEGGAKIGVGIRLGPGTKTKTKQNKTKKNKKKKTCGLEIGRIHHNEFCIYLPESRRVCFFLLNHNRMKNSEFG